MLVLFTDTDTDITPEVARECGYRLISMPYSIDSKTTYPYVDFEVFDARSFYDQLRSGVLPNTSALNAEQYKQYFEPVFADGDDILYVHFSRQMSATFSAMDQSVQALKKKYPERRFYELDTKGISIGSLNIIKEVSDLYKAGKTVDEILHWAETEVDHFAVYFFADDLRFFQHSGRVSKLAGTMGTLLGVRPIIHMNSEGKMVSIGKEKGRTKAVDRLIRYVEELGDHVEDHRVMIAHADTMDIVEQIIALLKQRVSDKLRIEVVDVNPTAGSHCGPNSVGISFHAIHR